MLAKSLGVLSSVFNLSGGIILAMDALRQRKRVSAERGAEQFLDIVKRHNLGEDVTDSAGHQLSTAEAFKNWFADRTQHIAWIGFVLMIIGFGLDVAAKLLGG
jgi:hypothetical protein